MPCVNADGTPTESGRRMLRALKSGAVSPEEIARHAPLPVFLVRSGLRDVINANLVVRQGDVYRITDRAAEMAG